MSKPPKLTRTDLESNIKKDLEKFLKSKGCKVRINKQDATTRRGWPDMEFHHYGRTGFLEVKKHEDSPYQLGQKERIRGFKTDGFYATIVFWENLDIIKEEITSLMKDWYEDFSQRPKM